MNHFNDTAARWLRSRRYNSDFSDFPGGYDPRKTWAENAGLESVLGRPETDWEPEPTVPAPAFRTMDYRPERDGRYREAYLAAAQNRNSEEPQVALNIIERRFISKDMERAAKDAINGLTNRQLPAEQIDEIYNQIIRNIPRRDAEQFQSIDPTERPITLTPEQQAILESQINQLREGDRTAVQRNLDEMRESGAIVCPACGK